MCGVQVNVTIYMPNYYRNLMMHHFESRDFLMQIKTKQIRDSFSTNSKYKLTVPKGFRAPHG